MPNAIDASHYWLTRLTIQRGLAFIYFIGFLIVINQFRPLVGARGLLPLPLFLKRVGFWDSPSLFFAGYSDRLATILGLVGALLSLVALTGLSERFGTPVSMIVWALLWMLYLSFVNVGQTFYGFGWEMLLLECGFLAIFLGARGVAAPAIGIWLFRWVLFRVMFGAGLIKLRGDPCWRHLTCLAFHYETQPLPNPASWYLSQLPMAVHKLGGAVTLFCELVVPFGYFIPGPVAWIAGAVTIGFQGMLIMSGNLSWLNYITIVIAFSCFDDRIWRHLLPAHQLATAPRAPGHNLALGALALLVGVLSIRPTINLLASRQMMNASFEPFHLVNTYGAFGSVTRRRFEIIVEGTDDATPTDSSIWRPYEFKGKPGDPSRAPPIVSPYHWKLDWQMWFAAMSPYYLHPWFVNFVAKLLENDRAVIGLLANDPFPNGPPKYVRAELYEYRFTDWRTRKRTGRWWDRTYVEEYLPPVSLENPSFRTILRDRGWLSAP